MYIETQGNETSSKVRSIFSLYGVGIGATAVETKQAIWGRVWVSGIGGDYYIKNLGSHQVQKVRIYLSLSYFHVPVYLVK